MTELKCGNDITKPPIAVFVAGQTMVFAVNGVITYSRPSAARHHS
ncbi:MAG: hypothetical protein ACR2P4_07890 [Gammaproteobacteria bacterium]